MRPTEVQLNWRWREFGRMAADDPARARRGFMAYSLFLIALSMMAGLILGALLVWIVCHG